MSGNIRKRMRSLETHHLDGAMLDGARIALVAALGAKVFELKYGVEMLVSRDIKVQYFQTGEDTVEAEIKYLGFKITCHITGLSHRATKPDRIVVRATPPWTHKDVSVQLMQRMVNLLGFVTDYETELVALVLREHFPMDVTMFEMSGMCRVPVFEVRDDGTEGDQEVMVKYLFNSKKVRDLTICWKVSSQGYEVPVYALLDTYAEMVRMEL